MSESPETSSYPTSLDTWVTLTDKEDLAEASDINKLKDAVENMQTELGTDPAGSLTDLKTRLAVSIGDDGGIKGDSSYPGSPTGDQLFVRTDEDIMYRRNTGNTAWLAIGGGHSRLSTTDVSITGSPWNTGDITIEAGKEYLIRFWIKNKNASTNAIALHFNSGSSTTYNFFKETRTHEVSPTITQTGDNSDAGPFPLGTLEAYSAGSTGGEMWGTINLNTIYNADATGDVETRARCFINYVYKTTGPVFVGGDATLYMVDFTNALTTFEFVSTDSRDFDAKVWTYEYALG